MTNRQDAKIPQGRQVLKAAEETGKAVPLAVSATLALYPELNRWILMVYLKKLAAIRCRSSTALPSLF